MGGMWGTDRRQSGTSFGMERPPWSNWEKCIRVYDVTADWCLRLEWRMAVYETAAAWCLQCCRGQIWVGPILCFFSSNNTIPCPEERWWVQASVQATRADRGVSETHLPLRQRIATWLVTFWISLRSGPLTLWSCNWMQMFERPLGGETTTVYPQHIIWLNESGRDLHRQQLLMV